MPSSDDREPLQTLLAQTSAITFRPYLRPQVWGGRRLITDFGKQVDDARNYGESWEISGHPHHVSKVMSGPLAGCSINEVWTKLRPPTAGPTLADDRFPVLLKLLDCREPLSVQVHPDDVSARASGVDLIGKTEIWVILDVEPGSVLYAGLQPGVTAEQIRDSLQHGTVASLLHQVRPQAGDCYVIPPGTVHAIGAGIMLAEIQTASDATFRLYDWGRTDRALHIEQALACMHWDQIPGRRENPSTLLAVPGCQVEHLATAPAFSVERWTFHRSCRMTGPAEPALWLMLNGTATCEAGNDGLLPLRKGDCVLTLSGPVRWELPKSSGPSVCLRIPLGSSPRSFTIEVD